MSNNILYKYNETNGNENQTIYSMMTNSNQTYTISWLCAVKNNDSGKSTSIFGKSTIQTDNNNEITIYNIMDGPLGDSSMNNYSIVPTNVNGIVEWLSRGSVESNISWCLTMNITQACCDD